MRLVTPDWLFQTPIDFEHKKWIFFSFLKEIDDDLLLNKINPGLDQIKYQISNLEMWKHSKELYSKKVLKGIDFDKMSLIYDIEEDNNPDLNEINDIVDFCLPYLIKYQTKISKLIQNIITQLKWEVIGIVPGYKKEGYILIKIDNLITVYQYTNIINMKFNKIDSYESGIIQNPNWIKLDLIKKYKDLPNPNCLLVETNNYPIEESLLPIIKYEINRFL